MSLEIVTHCYSSEEVPIYHKLLALQINSLFSMETNDIVTMARTRKINVQLTICYTPDDPLTSAVVDAAAMHEQNKITIAAVKQEKSELFRRAIGRNIAAKNTGAEVVWFTDCDHLFHYAAIRAAHKLGQEIRPHSDRYMIHPEHVMIHRAHDLGDALIENAFDYEFGKLKIPKTQFMPRRERKAIGGLQIVPGWLAKSQGYLDGTKWVEPVDSEHFLSCKCDVPFRKEVCKGSYAKTIPGVYRVRHTRAGRDRGTKDHGAKTR